MSKLFLLLLVPFSLISMTTEVKNKLIALKASSVMKPHRLKNLDLLYDENGFKIMKEESSYNVQNHQLDKLLLLVHKKKCLSEFLDNGYISVDQLSDGEFVLKSHVRGLGGGPALGAILYWGTKVVCYGTALAGAGAAVVTTGGLAGAASGALVAGTSITATAGTTVVAGAIAGAGLTAEAATLTTGVLATSGGISGAVATVESAAAFMGWVGTCVPWF